MLKKITEVLDKEKKDLGKYQKGLKNPVRIGRDYMQDPFNGMLPGEILVIAGPTSAGKTYELNKIKSNVMDTSYNSNASNFVWADYSLEMKLFSIMLRELSYSMSKSKKDILTSEFSEAEKAVAANIFSKYDERFYISEEPITPEQWYTEVDEFLDTHKDKDAVFIAVDHLALMRGKGLGKTAMIGDLLAYANELKLKYKNAFFIFLSQMSSTYYGRIAERSRLSQPQLSDLFYSSEIMQIADYVIVIINPEYLGITEYSSVSPQKYNYLEKYFTEEKKGKVSFETDGLIFHHLLKAREAEPGYDDIFITELRPRQEKVKLTVQQEIFQSKQSQELYAKLVGAEVKPNKDLESVFDDLPFNK